MKARERQLSSLLDLRCVGGLHLHHGSSSMSSNRRVGARCVQRPIASLIAAGAVFSFFFALDVIGVVASVSLAAPSSGETRCVALVLLIEPSFAAGGSSQRGRRAIAIGSPTFRIEK